MRIYKPKFKRPGTGVEYQSPKWYVQFYVGLKLFRRSLGTADKRVAEEKATALRKREERRAAGMLDPAEEHRDRDLDAHLDEFESMLRSRGVSAPHRIDRMACLREFVAHAGATRLPDLDEVRATAWLRARKDGGLSARSVNRRYQALRQFARWCLASRRLSWDPFASLRPLNERVDRRHVRRALSADELARLLDAARRRPLEEKQAERVRKGVTPREQAKLLALGNARALAYALAAGTGLRRGELKRLRWGDLDLDKRVVFVPAASAKAKRHEAGARVRRESSFLPVDRLIAGTPDDIPEADARRDRSPSRAGALPPCTMDIPCFATWRSAPARPARLNRRTAIRFRLDSASFAVSCRALSGPKYVSKWAPAPMATSSGSSAFN